MPDLIAQGRRRQQRWRKRVPLGIVCELGRRAGNFSAAWDESISRKHVTLRWDGKQLEVQVLPRVTNPLFFAGKQVATARLRPGEHFVLGETSFTLVDESAGFGVDWEAATELTFTAERLRNYRFGDPSAALEILSRLPEQIAAAPADAAVHEILIQTIFAGLGSVSSVALCTVDTDSPLQDEQGKDKQDGQFQHEPSQVERAADSSEVLRFLYWDCTDSGSLQVSRRLIMKAVKTGETVLHTWGVQPTGASPYTVADNASWAFAIPFPGIATSRWALYVSGVEDVRANREPPGDELKFAEIAVSTVASLIDARELQRRQSVLGQFFPKPVIAALTDDQDPDEVLAPREVEVTALFCDLRGFSRATEQAQDDLLGLLQRVSDALGVLTHHILAEGGVIGDFHGDAAMGFWGWPLPQTDAATRAARAAIEIRRESERIQSISNFRIGMGIASGRAVAGKIGTVDQVKVTAFGPAVNLASRLEMMTKRMSTTILTDETTARGVDPTTGIRTRRLARVLPYGMSTAIDLWQLLPSHEELPLLSDEDLANYESSLENFIEGDWNAAWDLLHRVPAGDRSKDFLTTYIASRNRQPPQDWDGIIRLESK